MTQCMLGLKKELKEVGAGVTDILGFAYHTEDIGFIQKCGVYGGAHLMRQLGLHEELEGLAEFVVEHGAIRQFPCAV